MRKFLNFANQNNKKNVSNAEEIHKSSMTYFNYLIRLGKKNHHLLAARTVLRSSDEPIFNLLA